MNSPPASVSHWYEDYGALDRVERCLLSALMAVPHSRMDCLTLTAADFSSPGRVAVYEAIMALRVPDPALVAAELERRRVPSPGRLPGWFTAISSLLDDGVWDELAVPDYVTAIKEASVVRRAEERRRLA